jgi:hypothetical protein
MKHETFSFLCQDENTDKQYVIHEIELRPGIKEFRTDDDILCQRLDEYYFEILSKPTIKVHIVYPKTTAP